MGVEDADEYCPHCDNHYVIEAVEPRPMVMFESDMLQDPRMKAKQFTIPEEDLLELMS